MLNLQGCTVPIFKRFAFVKNPVIVTSSVDVSVTGLDADGDVVSIFKALRAAFFTLLLRTVLYIIFFSLSEYVFCLSGSSKLYSSLVSCRPFITAEVTLLLLLKQSIFAVAIAALTDSLLLFL